MKTAFLLILLVPFSCKPRTNQSGQLLDEQVSRFALSLEKEGAETHLFTNETDSGMPFYKNRKLSCITREGYNGTSMQCKNQNIFADFIYRPDSNKISKLIYFPKGKFVDARSFYDCKVQSQDQFDCVPGKEVYPEKKGAEGDLVSPIQPTVDGAVIANFHKVPLALQEDQFLYRGMAPRKKSHSNDPLEDFAFLKKMGVESVLIFKTPNAGRDDIHEETEILKNEPFLISKVANIPFDWKKFDSFDIPCSQIIDALIFIKQNPRTFYHCTVGEDRTGALAGLAVLLDNPEQDIQTIFHRELCEHGYSSGDPTKPYKHVVEEIENPQTGITPVFLRMAYLIQSKKITWSQLDKNVCKNDPGKNETFKNNPSYRQNQFWCGPSTLYHQVD